MAQYIDKTTLVVAIKKRLEYNGARAELDRSAFMAGREKEDEDILTLIDSLEVKKEVLDENDKSKLMQKCVKTAYKRGYDMGVLQTTNKMNSNTKELDLENSMICKVDWYDGFLLDYTQEQQDKLLEKIGANIGDKIRVILIKE